MIYDTTYPTILQDILTAQKDLIIFALDRNYKYLAFNETHANVMRNIWDVDIKKGVNMLEYIAKEEDRKKAKANFDAALSGDKLEKIEEYGDENLSRKYYKDTYLPLVDSNLDIYGVLVRVEDITEEQLKTDNISKSNEKLETAFSNSSLEIEKINEELKVENNKRIRAELELHQAKSLVIKSLEKEMDLKKLKSKFVSMVSHEFRTPLTVIQAGVYLLEKAFERNDEEKFNKNLNKIESSVENMIDLMENVLNIGRLEQGEVKVSKSRFDIGSLLIELMSRRKEKDVKFIKNFEEKSVFLHTDGFLLSQILDNVLSNVIKYSPEDTTVEVNINETETQLIISIKDNGIGIEKEDLAEMLQPFKRGNKVSDIITGAGLGLAVISYSINLLNGQFDIKSEPDKGTTVIITLPKEKNG